MNKNSKIKYESTILVCRKLTPLYASINEIQESFQIRTWDFSLEKIGNFFVTSLSL